MNIKKAKEITLKKWRSILEALDEIIRVVPDPEDSIDFSHVDHAAFHLDCGFCAMHEEEVGKDSHLESCDGCLLPPLEICGTHGSIFNECTNAIKCGHHVKAKELVSDMIRAINCIEE